MAGGSPFKSKALALRLSRASHELLAASSGITKTVWSVIRSWTAGRLSIEGVPESHRQESPVGRHGQAPDSKAAVDRMEPFLGDTIPRHARDQLRFTALDVRREEASLLLAIEIDGEAADRGASAYHVGRGERQDPQALVGLEEESRQIQFRHP